VFVLRLGPDFFLLLQKTFHIGIMQLKALFLPLSVSRLLRDRDSEGGKQYHQDCSLTNHKTWHENSVQIWRRTLKTVVSVLCAASFPIFLGRPGGHVSHAFARIAGGLFGIYWLWRKAFAPASSQLWPWAGMALLLTGMGAFQARFGKREIILPIWFILIILYAVPRGS
jgi:hypothetical protein